MKKHIKSTDLYGRGAPLTFAGKGETYVTWLGFFGSLAMRIFMLIFFIDKMIILKERKDSNLSSATHAIDLAELGEVELSGDFNF